MVTTDIPTTQGVLLAGGLARRMGGGDKPMRTIGGRTILERVITRLEPQCDGLILNANGDPARFAAFGLPIVADDVPAFPGRSPAFWPRSTGPRRTVRRSNGCSAPPPTARSCRAISSRVCTRRAREDAQLAVAASGDQSHPVIGLWRVALRDELRHALVVEDIRKIDRWTARYPPRP